MTVSRRLPVVLRLMRAALVLLPAPFRDRYGDELLSVAHARWREASRAPRSLAGAALFGDLVATALRMRAAQALGALSRFRRQLEIRPVARATALALLVVGSATGVAWRLGWCPYDATVALHQRMIEDRTRPLERTADRRAGASAPTPRSEGDGGHGA